MNHKVHHIAGVVIGQGALLYFNEPVLSINTILVMVTANIASISPDIDKPNSFITIHQPMKLFSEWLERLGVPHRGPFHSLLFLCLIYVLLKYVFQLPDLYVWSISIAYASHIFLDMFTAKGVMLLYPFRFNFKFLPSFLAVDSDDDSIGQSLTYFALMVCFYALMTNISLALLSEVPFMGSYVAKLHSLLLDMTRFIWHPVVQVVKGFIETVRPLIKF